MLHVKHLMVENIFHDKLRDAGAIHASIEQDLIRAGIVAAKLAAPTASAPADVRALQRVLEIFFVELIKQRGEIEVAALRSGVAKANATAAHVIDALASALRTGVGEIRLDELALSAPAIHARQQQCGGTLQNAERRAAKQIREADENHVVAAAQGDD